MCKTAKHIEPLDDNSWRVIGVFFLLVYCQNNNKIIKRYNKHLILNKLYNIWYGGGRRGLVRMVVKCMKLRLRLL